MNLGDGSPGTYDPVRRVPGRLVHVNSDWYLLEAVDEHYRPVPPGVTWYTGLVTNLANLVQPMIRYQALQISPRSGKFRQARSE